MFIYITKITIIKIIYRDKMKYDSEKNMLLINNYQHLPRLLASATAPPGGKHHLEPLGPCQGVYKRPWRG